MESTMTSAEAGDPTLKKPDPLPRSVTLFVNDVGSPMRFYLRPGPAKSRFAALIEAGGGMMCGVQEPGAILLADPKELNGKAAAGYVSTHYILDCVGKNEQLEMHDYKLGQDQAASAPSVSKKKRSTSGRMGYTNSEDAAILQYLSRHKGEVKGNRIWQAMAREGITSHSWQSMKDRYRKHLQGRPVPQPDDREEKGEDSDDQDRTEKESSGRPIQPPLVEENGPESPGSSDKPPAGNDVAPEMGNEKEEQCQVTSAEEEETSEEESVQRLKQSDDETPELMITNVPQNEPRSPESGPPLQNQEQDIQTREVEGGHQTPPEGMEEAQCSSPAKVQETRALAQEDGITEKISVKGFVMNKDSQIQVEEMLASHANETPPQEAVQEAIKAVHFLMEECNLSFVKAMQILLKNSGDFQASLHYLRTGHRPDQLPLWTHEDDCVLLSGESSSQDALIEKYGEDGLAKRIAFLLGTD
ncbi:telomeric repeat-binding factor 2-interacting protein 1 isoform X3 [Lepisosteus oculatus]|uniref:telomeric repeat-binding factor 2-interacting protein 1 isoform X3 n=1 Tax=Lepisosteus oculatus TaxID=7918 RepID=UPI0037145D44